MSREVYCSFLGKNVSADSVIEGVVSFKNDGFTPVKGYFTPTFKNVGLEFEGVILFVMSADIIPSRFIPSIGGVYKDITTIPVISMNNKYTVRDQIKQQLMYSVDGNTIDRRLEYLNLLEEPKENKVLNHIKKILTDFSVGIEFETSKGLIPHHVALSSGLVPLRDGSIPGFEYVTVPLTGVKGAQTCINALAAIAKYTETDSKTCALHFHFGGVPRTEGFLVALWRVISIIQNEMYSIQPPYKMLNWGFKRKSYSEPYPAGVTGKLVYGAKDKDNFAHIFEYLSQGSRYSDYGSSLDNVDNHPSDPNNNRKWEIKTRYSILNLVPIIFGNKKTVEFRLSEITNDPRVVLNELIMFASILKFVMINEKEILKNPKFNYHLNLNTIIRSTDYSNSVKDYNLDYLSRKKQHYGRFFAGFEDVSKLTASLPGDIVECESSMSPENEVAYYNKYQHSEFIVDSVLANLRPARDNNRRHPNNVMLNGNAVEELLSRRAIDVSKPNLQTYGGHVLRPALFRFQGMDLQNVEASYIHKLYLRVLSYVTAGVLSTGMRIQNAPGVGLGFNLRVDQFHNALTSTLNHNLQNRAPIRLPFGAMLSLIQYNNLIPDCTVLKARRLLFETYPNTSIEVAHNNVYKIKGCNANTDESEVLIMIEYLLLLADALEYDLLGDNPVDLSKPIGENILDSKKYQRVGLNRGDGLRAIQELFIILRNSTVKTAEEIAVMDVNSSIKSTISNYIQLIFKNIIPVEVIDLD